MFVEVWALVVFAVALVGAGYWIGRATSSDRREAGMLRRDLESTREELRTTRERVNGHFEQSARLFGSLAEDYRALYDHFSDTARRLGFSESETESLLEQADRHLLEGSRRRAGPEEPATSARGQGGPAGDDSSDDEPPRAREATG